MRRRAKLTSPIVRAIHLSRGHLRAETLADRYGVNRSTIYSVWRGRSWRPMHPDGDVAAESAEDRSSHPADPDLAVFANALRACLGLDPIAYRRAVRS